MPNIWNWTVREVYYPKNSTTKHFYEAFRRPGGGHGFLLSFCFPRNILVDRREPKHTKDRFLDSTLSAKVAGKVKM
jgi:cystathionine beta-lyase/cystathionine gamma-synthase